MPIRIGFIGSGGIAGAHFNTLENIKDAQLVAFADMDKNRAEAAARRFDGQAYTDAKKMLEAETLDAVYVCLPPHVHGTPEILAVEKGCALFIEKPIANSMKTAEKIAAAIEGAKVPVAVGYHWRYYEATARAQALLSAKKTAQPAMCYGRWLGNFPGVPWWRKMDQSGGQLVEQTTHIIDLARYLMGEITSVSCVAALREMDKVYEGATVPDVMALVATFESGAIGHFSTTSMLSGFGDVGLDLYARNTVYKIGYNSLSVQKTEDGETSGFTGKNNATMDEDKAFIQAVKTGKRTGIKSTYADALKTLQVTLAANQSAKSGKVVKL
jgi:predicted dehydrogenase